MKELAGIHWFRKGLRLHDNPALVKALEKCQKVYPVFVWDPFFARNNFAGPNRWRFLVESLKDLDTSLRKLNSRLFVFRGNPKNVLPEIFKEWNIGLLSFEEDTEPYAKVRDNFILEHCKENWIEVISFCSHTLYDMNILYEANGKKVCTTYSSFTNLLDKVGLPESSCPPITKSFPDLNNESLFDPELYKLPTLEDDCCLSKDDLEEFNESESKYPGGESKALERLEQHLKDVKWICTFEKPETFPNSLKPSTTVLSPYLKFGCLSVKHFREKLMETYAVGKKRAENWGMRQVTLEGQVIWREFYYFCGAYTPNFDKIEGNPICRQINWDKNSEYLQAWKAGKTGYPFIDAIMNQLRQEGWIHHLARHAVACFLTRGDLYQSWEDGARIFEYYLLDADWSLNNGNWMWLSASAFFHQYFRVYSPVAFGKKTDPEGNYIRKYVPKLKNFPTKYIYEPWTAPIAIQKQAGCVIGIDYPKPIVDHAVISKKNMTRMKEFFGNGGDSKEKEAKKAKLK